MFKEKNDSWRHETEKNKFIKEQIRPNRKRQIFGSAKHVLVLVLSAVLFGAVASGSFYLIQDKVINKNKTDLDNDFLISNRGSGVSVRQEIISHNADGDLKLDDYNSLTTTLAALGRSYQNSLVIIYWEDDYKRMNSIKSEDGCRISGLIFKESGSKYFILSMTDDRKTKSDVSVRFSDGSLVNAKLLSENSSLGMMVLTVEKEEVSDRTRNQIDVISPDTSLGGLTLGSTVVMAGTPAGEWGTVVIGTVIKVKEKVDIMDSHISLFETDVSFCSGANGIVLDTRGKVVGLIACKGLYSDNDYRLHFLRISDIAQDLALMEKGKNTAKLGITGRDLVAGGSENNGIERGIFVTKVTSGSAAYIGKMRVADVITKIDGKKVSSMNELRGILLSHRPGDKITVCIARKSGSQTVYSNLKIKLH